MQTKYKAKNKQEDEVDGIVESIIDIPIKSLEEKIRNIKTDLKTRQSIFESSLSTLSKRELELNSHLWRMRYCLRDELNKKFMLENDLAMLRSMKIKNKISHFHDCLKLRDKLQIAKEKLSMEKEKRKLIKGE